MVVVVVAVVVVVVVMALVVVAMAISCKSAHHNKGRLYRMTKNILHAPIKWWHPSSITAASP